MTLHAMVLKMLRLSRDRRRLAFEAAWFLLLAGAARLLNRKTFPVFLNHKRPRRADPRFSLETLVLAVQAGSRALPMKQNCLVEALAAQTLFNRYGYVTELRIGVSKEPEGGLAAHAWVENRDGILIGGGKDRFTPLS